MTHGKPIGSWDVNDARAYAASRWSYGGSKLQRDGKAIELLVAAIRDCRCASVLWVPPGEHAGDCPVHDPDRCKREGCVGSRTSREPAK